MNATALSADKLAVGTDIFASEESILRALAFARHSAAPTKEKNRLRDLFLAYAGTADEAERGSVRQEIAALLKSQPAWAALAPEEASAGPSNGLGITRPAPRFAPPASLSAPAIEPAAAAAAPVPPPEPIPEPAAAVPSTNDAAGTAEPIAAEAAPAMSATPPAEPIPQPAAAAPSGGGRARIDAIKRDINSRVGTPVNLIEIDPGIGRAYMSALLDAMKRSALGDTDLSQLEAAYQAALSVIGDRPAAAASATAPMPTPVPAPEPALAPEPPPPQAAPAASMATPPEPSPEPIAPVPEPAVAPAVQPEPAATPAPTTETTYSVSGGLYHRPADEIDQEIHGAPAGSRGALSSLASRLWKTEAAETPAAAPPEPRPITPPAPQMRKIEVNQPAVRPATPPTPPAKPAAAPDEAAPLRSVKETEAALPEQMAKVKAEALARAEAAKKPIVDLNAPEIDQGLRQLLSEWELFRRSGFFGTGPAGIEHPLYKQMASLPMASVVTGRFEGATPEIKRQLSDYMNGWRYEQGILHDMGETFEHYLRRVIKQMLERQRKAPLA